jgi:Flp pilus assembly pilin Flp
MCRWAEELPGRDTVVKFLTALRSSERGENLIEYALLAGFLFVAAGAAMPAAGRHIGAFFASAKAHLIQTLLN